MTIEEYYNHKLPEINKIKEWGEEIFGEHNVDIQKVEGLFEDFEGVEKELSEFENRTDKFLVIYISIPEKTVTNENNNSYKITDGYVRIYLTFSLTISRDDYISFTRSKMTKREIYKGYCFSHAQRLDRDIIREVVNRNGNPSYYLFRVLCFGTGPIVTSNSRLQLDSTEENWRIFFNDLNDYFEIESISGGPYIFLESMYGSQKTYSLNTDFNAIHFLLSSEKTLIGHFLEYLNEKDWFLNIKYRNNKLPEIDTSICELYETISEEFSNFKKEIENYYKEEVPLYIQNSLKNLTFNYTGIRDNVVYAYESSENYNIPDDMFPIDMGFSFNGEPIKFTLKEDIDELSSNNKEGFSIDIFNRLLNSIVRCSLWINSYDTDTAYL